MVCTLELVFARVIFRTFIIAEVKAENVEGFGSLLGTVDDVESLSEELGALATRLAIVDP